MLEQYLPSRISNAIDNIPYNSLCELRLRSDNATLVNILGENYFLGSNMFTKSSQDSLYLSIGEIQTILQKISNNSMYTINDQLIEGYVTIPGGIRVGICGEVVTIDNKIKTIKNVTSLNFRFPHLIKNCSLCILPYIYRNDSVKSTLIVSPPGAGKTTYLRDIIYQLSQRNEFLNILVVDERDEISKVFNGNESYQLKNIDVCLNSSKKFGFTNGIRSMKPDVIITDEINLDNDLDIIETALTSGVKVIATMHASSIFDLKNKPQFQDVLNKRLFERFVILSNNSGVGTLEGVFDENLNFMGV